MGISQPQNLRTPPIEKLRPYGIRVSLPPGDPFRKLLGPEWHKVHWYPTPAERDAALIEMWKSLTGFDQRSAARADCPGSGARAISSKASWETRDR